MDNNRWYGSTAVKNRRSIPSQSVQNLDSSSVLLCLDKTIRCCLVRADQRRSNVRRHRLSR